MSGKNIKQVIEENTEVVFDRKFMKKFLTFIDRFEKKNENHINFLGGNYLGVYSLKWIASEDELELADEILGIPDVQTFRAELEDTPFVNPEFMVSSNPINLSLLWVAHGALISTNLGRSDQKRLADAAIYLLLVKFLSSIHSRWFAHGANEGTAKATYESLDRKSHLKKYGSWGAMLEARSGILLNKYSTNPDILHTFTDDEGIIKMVNDIQGRVKSTMISLRDAFERIRVSQSQITSGNKLISIDGEEHIKDIKNKWANSRQQLHLIIPNKNDFIQKQYVEAVLKLVTAANPRFVNRSLSYISNNYRGRSKADLEELVDKIIIFSFDTIRKNKMDLDNLPSVMVKLRDLYRSSQINDIEVLEIREKMGDIVETASGTNSPPAISSARIAVILYLVLRTIVE